ncbi:hypothetical protein M3Y99_01669000 [Aphelenchoides fujianensis]|nr:hypothetical protein M3Y99_01669000 [Aphelenchoides fujianensis]
MVAVYSLLFFLLGAAAVGAEVDPSVGESKVVEGALFRNELRKLQLELRQRKFEKMPVLVAGRPRLTAKDKQDLIAMFGSEQAAIEFAQGFTRYVAAVRKDLLPSSINFFWIFKQIGYAYFKAFMLLWGAVPNSTKLKILKFIMTNSTLRGLVLKFAPGLIKILFGNLGSALGLGASLGGAALEGVLG